MKKTILENYKFALLVNKTKQYILIKNQKELDVMIASDEIKDGDILLEITEFNLKVGVLKNFIELK